MSALCGGILWRLSGEYGVLRAGKIEQNEIFLVRRKELKEVAVKQRNWNCATGELRVCCVEGDGWNVNWIAGVRDLLTVNETLCSAGSCASRDIHEIKGYNNFGIAMRQAVSCRKLFCVSNALLRMWLKS